MDTRHRNVRELAPIPDAWPWWDGTPLPESPLLRWGYTTGAAATAALVASFRGLRARKTRDAAGNLSFGHVAVRFGDGKMRDIPLSPERPDFPGFVCVRKNGGDDPDCTHGIEILAKILPLPPGAERGTGTDDSPGQEIGAPDGTSHFPSHIPSGAADIVLARGRARIRLHALCGLGLATRPGLDCAEGHWAVNYATRAMILDNLEAAGMTQGHWVALLALPEGEKKAASTLNATLGVVGGLSLLGTTGLVRPFSHEAYLSSIRAALRQARLCHDTLFLGTGTRTLKTARDFCKNACQNPGHALFRHVPNTSFVSMADFFAESLEEAARLDFRRIVVVCMPGKLLKMAAGFDNTHAHKNAQNMELLANVLEGTCGRSLALDAAASVREAMELMDKRERQTVLDALARMALEQVTKRVRAPVSTQAREREPCEKTSCGILLTGFAGEVLGFFASEGFFD